MRLKLLLATLLLSSIARADGVPHDAENWFQFETEFNSKGKPEASFTPGVRITDRASIDLHFSGSSEGTNVEGRYRYELPITHEFSVFGRAGLGEHAEKLNNYTFHTLEVGVEFELDHKNTLWVSDKYTNSFSTGHEAQTNGVYLGGYHYLTDTNTIGVNVHRDFVNDNARAIEFSFTHAF